MAAVKCPVCHAICMFPVQSLNLSTHHVLDITGVCIKIDVSIERRLTVEAKMNVFVELATRYITPNSRDRHYESNSGIN